MRKLLGIALVGVMFSMQACDDEDSLIVLPELTFDPMLVTSTGGQSYILEEEAVYDTAYTNTYEKRDTTFEMNADGTFVLDADGKKVPVIGSDGNYIIKVENITFLTGKTGVFHKMKLIKLESKADTFIIHIKSNAKWLAPQYSPKKAQWFFNYNLRTDGNSLMGGGDSYFYFRTIRNKNKTRVEPVPQYIFTSDSSVMYQLNFGQAGERD
ncbi:MAG: hypothetical protein J5486_08900 [Bacteroidaceae bacterium]|nr:hypothetical protein [Bacteroidaceae bacterium]